jgi:tetratricopeptide (TPR) repeat protein
MLFNPRWKSFHWILVPACLAPVWAPADDAPANPGGSVAKSPPAESPAGGPTGPPIGPGGQTVQMLLQFGTNPTHAEKKHEFNATSARSTAVALNYCRASFHRLRQNPSRRVWFEEQQHILNNLNLREIADQEVIGLYTAVLDEVSKERIAEKERKVLQETYKSQVRRQVLSNAFILGAEVTTAQYVNAVRTGANSWWDYRATGMNRDLELWKVEKSRLIEVSDKSNKFLNTFWDLAKKKQIPDEWLIRGNNLDELEAALTELDPAVRLRVLKRMEPVMACYPPYYYHLGRTQQAQGMWQAASDTYRQLVVLGDGHFRSNDMLASGLANLAVIQGHLKHPDANLTAQRALKYATGAWQVNLVCAQILQQNGHAEEAEEAILRNLDVDLERPQSLASLMSLYVHSDNDQKLITALNDPATVAELPALSLLQVAGKLGNRRMPAGAFRQLVTSLYVYERSSFGRSQLVCMASPAWGLESAQTVMLGPQPERPDSRGISSRGSTQLSFKSDGLIHYTSAGEPQVMLEIRYADGQPVKLHLRPQAWSQEMSEHVEHQPGRAAEVLELFPRLAPSRPRMSFVVSDAEFGTTKVALWDRSAPGDTGNQQLLVDQKRAPGVSGTLPHLTTKPTQVIIEGVKPLPPLTQEFTRPATSKLSAEKPNPDKPVETAQPRATPPGKQAFVPAQLPTRSRVQLGEELESFEDD